MHAVIGPKGPRSDLVDEVHAMDALEAVTTALVDGVHTDGHGPRR